MCRAIVENMLSGTKAGFKATRNLVFNQKKERSTMNRQKSCVFHSTSIIQTTYPRSLIP